MFGGMKENKKGVVLSLSVSPGVGKFDVAGFSGNRLKLKTKAKPKKGLANKEIEKELGRIFNRSVKILSGFKSRNKTVFIEDLSREKTLQLLENL